jgi:hypothetical protein
VQPGGGTLQHIPGRIEANGAAESLVSLVKPWLRLCGNACACKRGTRALGIDGLNHGHAGNLGSHGVGGHSGVFGGEVQQLGGHSGGCEAHRCSSHVRNDGSTVTLRSATGVHQPVRENICDSPERGFALVGLHSCGDLVPTMLRVFAEKKEARALYAVSCCYMKLKAGTKPEVCVM